jgi:hypothetical protein
LCPKTVDIPVEPAFLGWLDALERRHMADLRFSEVTRALRALSSTYVERRERLAARSAFDSAGKRAAYALFYSPLHYLTVRGISARLTAELSSPGPHRIVDLGCGAGAAGAAFAAGVSAGTAVSVLGIDPHPWALTEAAFTYRAFGLDGDVRRDRDARVAVVGRLGRGPDQEKRARRRVALPRRPARSAATPRPRGGHAS